MKLLTSLWWLISVCSWSYLSWTVCVDLRTFSALAYSTEPTICSVLKYTNNDAIRSVCEWCYLLSIPMKFYLEAGEERATILLAVIFNVCNCVYFVDDIICTIEWSLPLHVNENVYYSMHRALRQSLTWIQTLINVNEKCEVSEKFLCIFIFI